MNAYELADNLLKHGQGCECAAYSAFECCCDAVWGENYTTQASTMLRQQAKRIEELEYDLKSLAKRYKALDRHKELSDEEIEEIYYKNFNFEEADIVEFARAIIKASRGEE